MFFHPAFTVFILTLFAVYWAAKPSARKIIMIAGSVGFYGAVVSANALMVLLFIFGVTYFTQGRNKHVKALGTLITLIPLLTSKYFPQMIPDFPSIVGISFFTFTAIARIWKSVERYQWINTANALFFFPVIFSGPILTQGQLFLSTEKDLFVRSLWRIAMGIFMKLVLAGWAGKASAGALTQLDSMGLLQWHGLILTYGAQIYWDFAGYTHMAIGLAGLFGYTVEENFNAPYLSKNLQHFWRRWHMSLAYWLKVHIYIPLGGNQKGPIIQIGALMIVMLVYGIWHGNTWAFFMWGLWHGFGLVWIKLTQKKWTLPKKFSWLSVIVTLYFVLWGWTPFFISDWSALFEFTPWIKNDFNLHGLGWFMIGVGLMISCLLLMKKEYDLIEQASKLPITLQGVMLLII